jgi:hypothetical protein
MRAWERRVLTRVGEDVIIACRYARRDAREVARPQLHSSSSPAQVGLQHCAALLEATFPSRRHAVRSTVKRGCAHYRSGRSTRYLATTAAEPQLWCALLTWW